MPEYMVKVKGRQGHWGHTTDQEYAKHVQTLLQQAYPGQEVSLLEDSSEKKLEVGMRVMIHSDLLSDPVPGVITARHPSRTLYCWEACPDGEDPNLPGIACMSIELEPINW